MLREKLKKYNIILASGSPRRQQFFKDLDLDFEIRLKEVEEIYSDALKAEEITNYLAELKANEFLGELSDNDILVTSDTIVWHENKALGKPKDYNDAFQMLQSLSGKTHEVITSVCIRTKDKTDTFFEVTKVTFNTLSNEAITYYLDNYKPFDKAGSYGIQEWIGLVAISRIDGSYANVVGLPVDKVYQHLLTFV
ncbi:septum formation protein [Flavobacterium cauense R2A-7]|uniref:dTTP/UTP pyrophosphatase n=1 Tax=Flavobacterium cauense R2A-7 TaxID=1341154 RepID=A0A562LW36_9FLAO|nr:Maf-like protein [Flavobacterium cauense]KGO80697.1 septum formation inhibitor Maf [Flavobacterium cauense R2A-7]TWI11845.1 septum formation protein [Flavobacterium cauense R2A-7]